MDEKDFDGEEWVETVSSEALQILEGGLLRGLVNLMETRETITDDRLGIESLWYAILILEYVARCTVRQHGLQTDVQLNLMRASKEIGENIFKKTKLGEMLAGEAENPEDILNNIAGKFTTPDVGEA